MTTYRTGLAALALASGLVLGTSQAGAQTLTIGVNAAPSSVDPHFHNGTSTNTLTNHLFDTLFRSTPDGKFEGALAESWKALSDTEWEVKLRPGVRFTDGRALTADDVVFTFERAPNVPNTTAGFGGAIRSVQRTEVVDPLTLRIHTPTPAPNLPLELSILYIVSRHVGEGATTEDYNAGRAAVGTGAYRLVRFSPGDGVELVRNDDWWDTKPDWEKVNFKFLPNAAGRTAALLSGAVDMIDTPSPNDIPRLRSDSRFSVVSRQGLRLIYLAPNQAAEVAPFVTDNEGKPLTANPLKDHRVREALSIALQRDGLAERVMQGTATPNGQWLPPGTYSYNPDVKVPPYDPDRAKRLLAEAGYPDGFRITLHVSQSTRPTDPIAAQAIAQMWTRIGVQTTVEALPLAAYAARAAKLEFAVTMWGWGGSGASAQAGYALVNVFNTFDRDKRTGAFNRSGYSNPALDTLTERALATLDDDARSLLLQKAVAMVMEDVAIIPLYQMTNIWATRKGVRYEPSSYDYTRAMQAHLVR